MVPELLELVDAKAIGIKHQKCIFCLSLNPGTNPGNFHKKYLELAILKNSVCFEAAISDFFCFISMKISQTYLLSRMDRNFDDYPDFQPKITQPKHLPPVSKIPSAVFLPKEIYPHFSHIKIDNNTWKLQFYGNSFMRTERKSKHQFHINWIPTTKISSSCN